MKVTTKRGGGSTLLQKTLYRNTDTSCDENEKSNRLGCKGRKRTLAPFCPSLDMEGEKKFAN